jgi:hypothetical protein
MSMNNERFAALLERQQRGLTLDSLFALVVAFGLLVSIAGLNLSTETAPSLARIETTDVAIASAWSECEPLAALSGERLC